MIPAPRPSAERDHGGVFDRMLHALRPSAARDHGGMFDRMLHALDLRPSAIMVVCLIA
jgi:hypothetical protein